MKYDPDFENAMLMACLPFIEKTIRSLHFMPWDDLRSIAFLSALCVIRSESAKKEALEERIQERIIEDLNEEKRKHRERGWSRFNVFSLDRSVSSKGSATFLDWLRSPDQTEHIVLVREFQRSLSDEEKEAVECLSFDCSLREMGIWGKHEVFVRNRIRKKWISVFGEKEIWTTDIP